MGKYGVEFESGRVVEVDAKHGDEAKQKAYAIVRRDFPDEPKGHPERKVKRVIHPDDV